MSKSFKFIPAEKFCNKVTDGTHESPKQADNGKPLITSKHIKKTRIDFGNAYLISESDFKKINERSKVDKWDVIISMIGEYCGYCYIEKNDDIQYAIKNVGLFKTGNRLKAEWLYYYLNSHIGKAYLTSIRSGSSQPYLTLGGIRSLPILIRESENIQKKIIYILSALDAKIELNNKINAELEAMAKTLYGYWFVQFDFPNENGKPYKSSGGKMVYNEVLKREIPEGWGVGNILKVADLIGGGTPSKKVQKYWDRGTIPFFTPTDADNNVYITQTEDHITNDGLNNCSSPLLEYGALILTARGSVGKLTIVNQPMAMNQSCYALKSHNNDDYSFLYYLTKDLIHHLKVKASGSVFNSIVSNDIKYTMLAIPGNNYVALFSKICNPIFEKINIHSQENQTLAQLRDWLLPMLMNGQVKVE